MKDKQLKVFIQCIQCIIYIHHISFLNTWTTHDHKCLYNAGFYKLSQKILISRYEVLERTWHNGHCLSCLEPPFMKPLTHTQLVRKVASPGHLNLLLNFVVPSNVSIETTGGATTFIWRAHNRMNESRPIVAKPYPGIRFLANEPPAVSLAELSVFFSNMTLAKFILTLE